ncbi:MAG: hypothetical protein AB7O44_02265 [Hyphomicrobiaceae bacterium]
MYVDDDFNVADDFLSLKPEIALLAAPPGDLEITTTPGMGRVVVGSGTVLEKR